MVNNQEQTCQMLYIVKYIYICWYDLIFLWNYVAFVDRVSDVYAL